MKVEILNNLRCRITWSDGASTERTLTQDRLLHHLCGPATHKWPVKGLPETLVGNVVIYVKPKGSEHGRPHRAIAICPDCSTHVPFGRFHQHWGTPTCRGKAEQV